MNRKDFFKTLIGGAAVAASAMTSTNAKEIKVNPVPFDASIPTIGINKFDSVNMRAHSIEIPNNSGWTEYVSTGEKTFTFKGVSTFHLSEIDAALFSGKLIRIRLSWKDRVAVMTGVVRGFSSKGSSLDFIFNVKSNDELKLS